MIKQFENLFVLETAASSYVFRVLESGHLEHLYYGKRLTIENAEEQVIFIAQTDRMKQAVIFKQMIEERFHPRDVRIMDVHVSCGVNVGPGLMAAYYIGKPISKDLAEEKAIIEAALNQK